MKFIKIENNKIVDIKTATKKEYLYNPDDYIEVPLYFGSKIGEDISFYNNDFSKYFDWDKITEIDDKLRELDLKRSRPISDLTLGINTDFATQKLQEIETQRTELTAERNQLLGAN